MLEHLQESEPKSYWKLANELTGESIDDELPQQNSLYEHFTMPDQFIIQANQLMADI
jgi:hypothetical protein